GNRVEERWQPAGALVVFDGSEVALEEPVAEPGTPAARAATVRSDALEQLRDENHELRSRLRAAERESEALSEELDEARARGNGRRGRSTISAGDPTITPEQIKKALRDDGFTLYCQPVLDLRADRIAQHEL